MQSHPGRRHGRGHSGHGGRGRRHARGCGRAPAALLAAFVTVSPLLGGCTTSTGSPGGSVASPAAPGAEAVGALLAARARAVAERDRIRFVATLSRADPAFRTRQGHMFDALLALPAAGWREELADPRPVATAAGRVTLKLTLRYRLRGYDQAEVARTRYLALTHRAGTGWVIAGDGRAQGFTDDPEVWDGGPSRVVRGRHSLVIGTVAPAGTGPGAGPDTWEAVARALDAAVPEVSAVVGTHWAGTTVALVPADGDQAARLAGPAAGAGIAGGIGGGTATLDEIAALATVVPGPEPKAGAGAGADGPGADRIVVSPAVFARLNPLGRRVVLTHELTHVATRAARDGTRPLWLIEGFADYVGYRGTGVTVAAAADELRREIAAGRPPGDLPDQSDFTDGAGRAPQAYAEAWLACRMIAERYGEKTLVAFYRAAGSRTAGAEERALRTVLGVGRERFVAMWRDYVRRELR